MLLPSQSAKVRDLRSSRTQPESRIGARTPIYAVVESCDPGTSGPFFYDPAVAVLFSFYKHISEGHFHCRPVNPNTPTPSNMHRGTHLVNWLFSSNEYYLLELRSNDELVFENKFIDADIDRYVDYKFGRHNPATLRTNINLGLSTNTHDVTSFMGDRKWNQKTQPNIAFYNTLCMLENFIFDFNGWITMTDNRLIDLDRTMSRFNFYDALLTTETRKNKYLTYTHVREVALCVVKPQEIFDERCLYTVNWENVWLGFISMRAQNTPLQSIKIGFQSNPTLFMTRKEFISNSSWALNQVVCLYLAAQCHSLRDVSAFFSTCRFYRRIYLTFNMQQVLLRRFLPHWSECFSVLPKQLGPDRAWLLGLPCSPVDQGWWNVCPILFQEDLPELETGMGNAVVNDLQRSDNSPGDINKEKSSKLNMLTHYRRRLIKEDQINEADAKKRSAEEEKRLLFATFDPLPRKDVQLLSILKPCTSFLSMMVAIYDGTLTTNFQEVCTVGIRVDDDPPFVCSSKKTALPPNKPLLMNTAIDFFAKSPMPEYSHTVSCFSTAGTWTHRFSHPFFQDPAFSETLARFKDLSRYSCSLRASLHKPSMSRLEVENLHAQEKREWIDRRRPISPTEARLDFRTQLILWNGFDMPVMSIVFQRKPKETYGYRVFFCFESDADDESLAFVIEFHQFLDNLRINYMHGTMFQATLENEPVRYDDPILTIGKSPFTHSSQHTQRAIALTSTLFDDKDPHVRNSMFYCNYMVTCCVIRWLIHRKGVCNAEWRSNF